MPLKSAEQKQSVEQKGSAEQKQFLEILNFRRWSRRGRGVRIRLSLPLAEHDDKRHCHDSHPYTDCENPTAHRCSQQRGLFFLLLPVFCIKGLFLMLLPKRNRTVKQLILPNTPIELTQMKGHRSGVLEEEVK